MNEEILSGFVDRPSFKSDADFGIEEVTRLISAFNQLTEIKKSLGGINTVSGIAEQASKANTLISQITEGTKKLSEARALDAKVTNEETRAQELHNKAIQNDATDELMLTSKEYQQILEKVAVELEGLTDQQKLQLKQVTDNFVASEKVRQAAGQTVKLIRDEIAATEKLDASKSALALSIAEQKAQQQILNREIQLEAKVNATERNSTQRAAALILQYSNAKGKLNMATEEGRRLNESYNKAIQKSLDFQLKYADVETKRVKNIGKYNEAAKIVVDALDREQKKLQELILTREKAAKVQQVTGFARGNTPGSDPGAGPTAKANTDSQVYKNQGDQALYAAKNIALLDEQIAQSRIVISGFNRVSTDLPLGKESEKAEVKVKQLSETLLLLEKNGLGATEGADTLRAQIAGLTDQLYKAETAGSSLEFIDAEIKKLNVELSNTAKDTPAFQKLTTQINTLKNASTTLGKNFAGPRQEMRALTVTAQQLGTAFGVDSDQFRKFTDLVGARKNELGDVQAAINFKSSDTKGLDAALQGVQALTGAYGAFQSVQALTGSTSEELAESQAKLQAVMTAVVSIQSIVNALQSESALIQGGLAAKARILALVDRIAIVISGQKAQALAAEIAATETSTLVTSEKAIVEKSALASTRASAIAHTQSAISMKSAGASSLVLSKNLQGVAVAEGAVATGASTAARAIAATGLGLLVIGISYAVVKLIDAIQDWAAADASTQKANEALADSVKSLSDETKAYEALLANFNNRELVNLQRRNSALKALGVTQTEALAMDLAEANKRAEIAAQSANLTNATDLQILKRRDEIQKKETTAIISAQQLARIEQQRSEYIKNVTQAQDENYDSNIENFDKLVKQAKDVATIDATVYQDEADKFNTFQDTRTEALNKANEAFKLSQDERRKLVLENVKISVDTEVFANDRIINNDRATLDAKLKALANNIEQKKRLIAAENAAIQSDPTISADEKGVSARKASQAKIQAEIDGNQKANELKEQFRLRDLAAQTEHEKKILDIIVKTNEAIYKNEAATEADRLDALRKAQIARRQSIDADFKQTLSTAGITDPDIERIKQTGFFEIQNKKITNQELIKLISDYEQAQLQTVSDTYRETLAITQDYYQKEEDIRLKNLRNIERENSARLEDRTDTFNNQLISLNTSFRKGEISTSQYNKRKLKLEADYSRDSILIEIDRVEKQIAANRPALDAQKKLQDELKALQNPVGPETDDQKVVRFDRVAVVQAELEKITETVDKESELYTQLSALKKDLSTSDTQTFIENNDKVIESLENINSIAQEVFSGVSGVLAGIAERNKGRIQEQIDNVDKRTEAELKGLEAQSLGEQEKADKTKLINDRAAAEKELLADKQKQIDRQTAIAQKNLSIFQIILSTAVNVAKAVNPFSKILAAVSGAAQLAIAVATPIPKFKFGKPKGNDYEGPAWVDDGGHNEPILRADTGRIEISTGRSKDRLTYLGKNDIVWPSMSEMLKSFSMPVINNNVDILPETGWEKMAGKIDRQNFLLEEIAAKPVQIINNSEGGMMMLLAHGTSTLEYLNDRTNWNKR